MLYGFKYEVHRVITGWAKSQQDELFATNCRSPRRCSCRSQGNRADANQLYRTLSPQGNPELRSLFAVLKALGLRLAIQTAQPHAAV